MEDVLEVYHLPYDPGYPVVCMDESFKQMIGEVREPIPCAPGQPARIDDEYVRNGVAEIFMEVEPLAGKRHVVVTERRTRRDWALQIQQMLDERYPNAVKVRLVRQSDFSSAKHMPFKGHMIRSNRVMKNIRTMNSLTPFFFLFLYAHSCRMNLAKLQRQLLSIVFYCVWQ